MDKTETYLDRKEVILKVFTYNDYLDLEEFFTKDKFQKVEENGQQYEFRKKELKKENIVLKNQILTTLQKEKEMKEFLSDFLNFQCEENSKFILYQCYFSKEDLANPNLIYYFKKQNIFFILHYIEKKDSHLVYQVLKNCFFVMKQWNEQNRRKSNLHYPVIVPIILYVGKEAWNFRQDFKQVKWKYTTFKRYGIHLFYNLIDVHQYSKKELEEKHSLIASFLFKNKYLQIN